MQGFTLQQKELSACALSATTKNDTGAPTAKVRSFKTRQPSALRHAIQKTQPGSDELVTQARFARGLFVRSDLTASIFR
jgi:hypothetical protein